MNLILSLVLFLSFSLFEHSNAQEPQEVYQEIEEALTKADKKLNIAYQEAIASINKNNPEQAKMIIEILRASQRAWLKYRKEQIKFVSSVNGIGSSTARAVGAANYSIELTEARIQDLKNFPNPY